MSVSSAALNPCRISLSPSFPFHGPRPWPSAPRIGHVVPQGGEACFAWWGSRRGHSTALTGANGGRQLAVLLWAQVRLYVMSLTEPSFCIC